MTVFDLHMAVAPLERVLQARDKRQTDVQLSLYCTDFVGKLNIPTNWISLVCRARSKGIVFMRCSQMLSACSEATRPVDERPAQAVYQCGR